MPLEPVPPPSPVGKSSPPPKHRCDCSSATHCYNIPISQISHHFHFVPKTFIDMVFFPPAIPAWVLRHVKAHPPTWTLTLRAGPWAGTILTVPMVPIHCSSNSHKAVKWLVSTFHLFKGSLNRSALTAEGKVASPLVHVFQNNMLLHISAQLQLYDHIQPTPKPGPRAPPTLPSPPTDKSAMCPPLKQHASCSAEIATLHAEIADLRKKIAEVLDHPPPPSPCTILATVLKPPHSCPSSPTSSSLTSIRSDMAHPDHPWLQEVLDHAQCPPFIRSIDSSMSPYFVTGGGNMPEDMHQVVQLLSLTRTKPCYIGIDSNGDLQVAIKVPAATIHSALAMSSAWHVTTFPDPPRPSWLPPCTDPHSLPFSLQRPVLQGWPTPPVSSNCPARIERVSFIHSPRYTHTQL